MRRFPRSVLRPGTSRSWSIRAKIISLLLVPWVTLVAMWILATAVTLGPGLDLLEAQNNVENVGRPAQDLLAKLQAERKASVVFLATGRHDDGTLKDLRAQTDASVATFRSLAGGQSARNAQTDLTRQSLANLMAGLDSLGSIRNNVDVGQVDRAGAMRLYTDVIDGSFQLFDSLVRIAEETLARESHALVAFGRASEVLAQEDAVVTGAMAVGSYTPADLSQSIQLIGAQRLLFTDVEYSLNATDRDEYRALTESAPFIRLGTLENRIVDDGRAASAVPVSATTWHNTYDEVDRQLKDFNLRAADRLIERSKPAAIKVLGRLALAAVLGLITVVVTLIASIRTGRSLIGRLAGLRQAAQELTLDRLPRVMGRLRRGEDVDVENEAPALPYGDDEIGQVGHAFNELQRTAVNSAIDEANVRRGLNEVFLNIARRSQTLLHRQLSILDGMERRADRPDELEDLFRVDHLATRMRRHAEDLVILAGAAPGRGWRNPVPLVDVVRGAVSEVEDYARVSIRPIPEIALAGRAVGDAIHMLAELIENATSFSPPHTRVTIGGEAVAHGFAIEIEDRGLGLSSEQLAELNARLTSPPEFDPSNSAQLGLFVVARLAARHDLKVQLRTSAYGGVTAVVLLPEELILPVETRPRAALAATAHPHPDSNLDSQPAHHPENNGASRDGLYRSVSVTPAVVVPEAAAEVVEVAEEVPPAKRARKAVPKHSRPEVIDAPAPDALPRRIRQRNLEPRLRDDSGSAGQPIDDERPPFARATRTPEELRAMMSSFQAGMNRGRLDADDLPSSPDDHDPSERDAR
jgi:signal transduction histidine kinase